MTMSYQIATADVQEQQVACVHGRILPDEMRAFLTAAYSRIPAATTEDGGLGHRVSGPSPWPNIRVQILRDVVVTPTATAAGRGEPRPGRGCQGRR
jgi:hypothetical protein